MPSCARAGLRSWLQQRQAGDPDHHEFVDVVCEDGEEFDAFEEEVAEVCGFFEDAAVELDERDFLVDIEGFVHEADVFAARVADIIGGHLYGVSKGLLYVYFGFHWYQSFL